MIIRWSLAITLGLVISMKTSVTRAFRQCGAAEECVNLQHCERALRLLYNNDVELTEHQAQQLRDDVCDLDLTSVTFFKVKVCCVRRWKDKLPLPEMDANEEVLEESAEATSAPPHVSLWDGYIKETLGKAQAPVSIAERCRNFYHKSMDVLPKECGESNSYEHDIRKRIMHGVVTPYYLMPWMVQLANWVGTGYDNLKPYCSGTLISKRYVLTAAHCVNDTFPELVVVGVNDWDNERSTEYSTEEDYEVPPTVTKFAISRRTVHPRFNLNKILDHDIALLRLVDDVTLSVSVAPICLPIKERFCNNLKQGKLVTSGWGNTESGKASMMLRHAELPFVATKVCEKMYQQKYRDRSLLHKYHICAGGGKQDACHGDSGGPLQMTFVRNKRNVTVQYGIVNKGSSKCGEEGVLGVYTDVRPFMSWILDTMALYD